MAAIPLETLCSFRLSTIVLPTSRLGVRDRACRGCVWQPPHPPTGPGGPARRRGGCPCRSETSSWESSRGRGGKEDRGTPYLMVTQ